MTIRALLGPGLIMAFKSFYFSLIGTLIITIAARLILDAFGLNYEILPSISIITFAIFNIPTMPSLLEILPVPFTKLDGWQAMRTLFGRSVKYAYTGGEYQKVVLDRVFNESGDSIRDAVHTVKREHEKYYPDRRDELVRPELGLTKNSLEEITFTKYTRTDYSRNDIRSVTGNGKPVAFIDVDPEVWDWLEVTENKTLLKRCGIGVVCMDVRDIKLLNFLSKVPQARNIVKQLLLEADSTKIREVSGQLRETLPPKENLQLLLSEIYGEPGSMSENQAKEKERQKKTYFEALTSHGTALLYYNYNGVRSLLEDSEIFNFIMDNYAGLFARYGLDVGPSMSDDDINKLMRIMMVEDCEGLTGLMYGYGLYNVKAYLNISREEQISYIDDVFPRINLPHNYLGRFASMIVDPEHLPESLMCALQMKKGLNTYMSALSMLEERSAHLTAARLISLIPFVGGRLAEVYVKEHEELHKYLSGEKGTYRIGHL